MKSKAKKNASKSSGGFFDVEAKRAEIRRLEEEMNVPGFWDNPQKAQEHGKSVKRLKDILEPYDRLRSRISDLVELAEMAEEEGDDSQNDELQAECQEVLEQLNRFELQCTLNGEHDEAHCYLNIHPGAGGTESCDWASMLLRMYLRFAERRGWKTEVIDLQDGEEAGIKNATIHVIGDRTFGYLKPESGIHRLVRISPFDANKRRHTSFAAVHILPELEDDIELDINPNDLRVDTYRSSGAGGQHVNVTDSAIRITHLPTGIVVTCQNERSQRQNRETAMKILRARLYEIMQDEQAEKISEISGEKRNIAWGNQIRSYVFHPYNLIKDHRTGYERGDIQNVMDGDLDEFIDAWLRASLAGGDLKPKSADLPE